MAGRDTSPRIDPDNPDGDGSGVVDPIVELWAGVLLQAVRDTLHPVRGNRAAHVQRAREWVADTSRCGWLLVLVGVEPSYWLTRCVPALQQQWQLADEREPRPVTPERRERVAAGLRAFHARRQDKAAA